MTDTGISDTMKAMVLYSLRNQPKTRITFTKVDGTERTLVCTLRDDLIPASSQDEDRGTEKRKSSPAIQVVWDLESNGWRSFRWDSLKSFAGVDTNEEFTING
jgi:hypothetical protein